MKYGKTLPLRPKYFRLVDAEITRIFGDLIYKPLQKAAIVEPSPASTGTLPQAIQAGRIWYEAGVFHGSFNSRITKALREMGATYNKRDKTFIVPAVPAEVSIAQAGANMRLDKIRKNMVQTLDGIKIDSIDAISNLAGKYHESITWMNDDWLKAIQGIAIPPKPTPVMQGRLTAEWAQNLDLYVKKWVNEEIIDLRGRIQENAFSGHRSENLEKMIADRYQVSKTKAKFLARQETSLLMSKFHETRYADIGVTTYRWAGSLDARERPDHKELEGKTFAWSSPPVVDRKTGRRANPGEDFGCRCVCIPVIL